MWSKLQRLSPATLVTVVLGASLVLLALAGIIKRSHRSPTPTMATIAPIVGEPPVRVNAVEDEQGYIEQWLASKDGDPCERQLATNRRWSQLFGAYRPMTPENALPNCPVNSSYVLRDDSVRLGDQVHSLRIVSTISADPLVVKSYQIWFDERLAETVTGQFYFDGEIVYGDDSLALFFMGAQGSASDGWLTLDATGQVQEQYLQPGIELMSVGQDGVAYRQYGPTALELVDIGDDWEAYCAASRLATDPIYSQDYQVRFALETWHEPELIDDTTVYLSDFC